LTSNDIANVGWNTGSALRPAKRPFEQAAITAISLPVPIFLRKQEELCPPQSAPPYRMSTTRWASAFFVLLCFLLPFLSSCECFTGQLPRVLEKASGTRRGGLYCQHRICEKPL